MIPVLILAGGFGSRLSEVTETVPKPMVEVAGKPILFHIIEQLSSNGLNDFTILCGYKGRVIRKWVANLNYEVNDVSINLKTGKNKLQPISLGLNFDWNVNTLETGINSETGERIRLGILASQAQTFIITYGDCIANVNIKELLNHHERSGKVATLTAVHPTPRFGHLELEGNNVARFSEKQSNLKEYINGGYFVVSRNILNYLDEGESFEFGTLKRLAETGNLGAYKHEGFWHPMDTLRDRNNLNELAKLPIAPWMSL